MQQRTDSRDGCWGALSVVRLPLPLHPTCVISTFSWPHQHFQETVLCPGKKKHSVITTVTAGNIYIMCSEPLKLYLSFIHSLYWLLVPYPLLIHTHSQTYTSLHQILFLSCSMNNSHVYSTYWFCSRLLASHPRTAGSHPQVINLCCS